MAEEYKKEIIERLNNVQQERLLKIMLDCVKSLEKQEKGKLISLFSILVAEYKLFVKIAKCFFFLFR